MPETGLTVVNNAVTTMDSQPLEPTVKPQIRWTNDEIEIIRNSIVGPDITPPAFKWYLAAASAMGLNPLLREIYIIPFKDDEGRQRFVLITGIDGFYKQASRSGRFIGWTQTVFTVRFEDGLAKFPADEYDPDWGDNLVSATVGIRIAGFPEPVYTTVMMRTYAKTKTLPSGVTELRGTWKTMPERLLEKCGQALLIRQNLPGLGQIFVQEELDHASASGDLDRNSFETPQVETEPVQRRRKTQILVPPEEPAQGDVIETTATVVEPESEAKREPEPIKPAKEITDLLTSIFKYLKGTHKLVPDGVHAANRFMRAKFDVDEPELIPVERLEELRTYAKTELLEQLVKAEFVTPRGK